MYETLNDIFDICDHDKTQLNTECLYEETFGRNRRPFDDVADVVEKKTAPSVSVMRKLFIILIRFTSEGDSDTTNVTAALLENRLSLWIHLMIWVEYCWLCGRNWHSNIRGDITPRRTYKYVHSGCHGDQYGEYLAVIFWYFQFDIKYCNIIIPFLCCNCTSM